MAPTWLTVCVLAGAAVVVSAEEQCRGGAPMLNMKYGVSENAYDTAEHICCNNHQYAEYSGFLQAPAIDLFGKLDPNNTTVFYDSVCGKPLFVAPVGRTFEEFKVESIAHGWPSFRPEETIDENVFIESSGRMYSVCGTHLGHNLPDMSGARYCIDLVCIAGIHPDEGPNFVPISTYKDKTRNAGQSLPSILITIIVIVVLGVFAIAWQCFYSRHKQRVSEEHKLMQVQDLPETKRGSVVSNSEAIVKQ